MESETSTHFQARPSANATLHKCGTRLDDGATLCDSDSNIFPELISQLLLGGCNVRFRAPGNSMRPAILDGDVLLVAPIKFGAIVRGDIILYRADEHIIAHRVIDIESAGSRILQLPNASCRSSDDRGGRKCASHMHCAYILRGDASNSNDEPVYADQVLGRVIAVTRNNRSFDPYSVNHKFYCRARKWGARLIRFFSGFKTS